jgi:hypothetical protein
MKDLTKGYYRVNFNDGSFSIASFSDEGVAWFRNWVLKNKPDYKSGLLNARGMFLDFLSNPGKGGGIFLGANHQDEAVSIPQDWESWGL